MIYRSNLAAPDLSPHFKLLVRPRPWSLGHDIPSDPDYEPENCYLSHDEAALLYHCVKALPGAWLDIGCRFGWSTAHIAAAALEVIAIDQALDLQYAWDRFEDNLLGWWPSISEVIAKPTVIALPQLLLRRVPIQLNGFCIDANHDSPEPTNDAKGCLRIAAPDCCIVFHDFRGKPIRDAVRFLMSHDKDCPVSDFGYIGCKCGRGFKCRIYWTPSMMAVCWRGNFVPPVHVRDPQVDWVSVRRGAKIDEDFDLSRCV